MVKARSNELTSSELARTAPASPVRMGRGCGSANERTCAKAFRGSFLLR